MRHATKQDAIRQAQAQGSTATTWHGARRWLLAHVTPLPLDRRGSFNRHAPVRAGLSMAVAKARYARELVRRYGPQRQWPAYDIALTGRDAYRRLRWIERIEARLDRTAQAMGFWSLLDAEELAAELTQPYLARAAAAAEANWPYRRSESRWAGGSHSVCVSLGTPMVSCASERAWSSNGKWSGSNSFARISTDIATLLAFPELRTRDGLLLCKAESVGPREYRVRWIEQSTGVSLKTVDGYLIRGYHCRAVSLEQARKKAATARRNAVAATLQARDLERSKRGELRSLRAIWLTVDDSIRAGNCKPSTEQFARQMWAKLGAAGPCAVRADVVLADRDDYYTRRALGIAQGHSAA